MKFNKLLGTTSTLPKKLTICGHEYNGDIYAVITAMCEDNRKLREENMLLKEKLWEKEYDKRR